MAGQGTIRSDVVSDLQAHPVEAHELPAPELDADLLALDDALDVLEATDAQAAEVVKLRYFSGLTAGRRSSEREHIA